MRKFSLMVIFLAVIGSFQPALAGEFYKLYPGWLEIIYHVVLAAIAATGLIVCLTIYGNFKGGKLGLPWIIILVSFIAGVIRSAMSILTILNIQYFQAIAFAGADVLFFILLLIGLLLYKIRLE